MVATLDFQLKDAHPDLFSGVRWSVLTMFILHSNNRNRSWPSMRSLAERLGKSLPHVTAAKQWLIDHGAVSLVPYELRVGEEKTIPNHQHLYELTGKIKFDDGTTVNYLHISPENGQSDDQPRESSKRRKSARNDQPRESSASMINSVDDQILSPLSIPNKDSNTPSNTNVFSGAPTPNGASPANEPPQPLSEIKRLPEPQAITDLIPSLKQTAETQESQQEDPERKVPPKESVPPQAGILAAAEQSTQAMASAMKTAPYAPDLPLPAFDGHKWYMCAGDNYLIHLAKPTKSGKQIKPVCGRECSYGTDIAGVPIGNRQPCQGCLRKMAPPAITPEVKSAFAVLCKKDWGMDADAKVMMKALKQLKDPTVDRMRTFYCNWYKQDWRGKRGDAPKPHQVVEQWTPYTTEDCKQAEDIFGKGVNNGTANQTATTASGTAAGTLGQPPRADQPGRDLAAEGRADAAAAEEFKRAWTKRPLRL